LSAWVHTYFLVGERRLLYPLLVALGLTHFFGTLLSCLCLAWLLLERRPLSRNLLPCAISGATILIWPLIFLSVGGGRDVLGGAFWIEASTYDIGHHALSAAFPFAAFLLGVSGLLQYQAAPSVVLFLAALIGGLWAARHMRDANDQLGQGLTSSLFLLTSFIISVILINYLTPISTTRNFIVLVPTGAFFCASLFITLLSIDRSRTSAMVFLVTFVLINQSVVFSKMLEKFYPLQDLRGAAAELLREVEADPSREVFVFDSFPTLGIPEFNREWFSYYFFGALSVELLDPEDADSVPQNSLVFFAQVRGSVREQGQCSNDLIADLAARDIGYEAWFAKQARECTTGYLLVVDR
jgi:hypothetical protein